MAVNNNLVRLKDIFEGSRLKTVIFVANALDRDFDFSLRRNLGIFL